MQRVDNPTAGMPRSLGLLLASLFGAFIGCGLTAHVMSRCHAPWSSLSDPNLSNSWRLLAKTDEQWAKEQALEHSAAGKEGADAGGPGEKAGGDDEEDDDEEGEFGGIFALEEVDPLAISSLIIGLIVVTIGYEQATDLLQERVFNSGIGNLLLGKMVRTLHVHAHSDCTAR